MINRKRNYTWHFMLMAVLTATAIGVVNYLGMQHRSRIDLTGDKRFTLSEGTQRLFDKLPETITLTYYVSEEPPPRRINLERDVLDKLDELAVSSRGKLQYRVERISNEESAAKLEEFKDKGIVDVLDVTTSGSDESAQVRGVHGFFSALEIRYSTAEPKVINGIYNLVDKTDEAREHRVDTLEFDIAYTVLTMQHETRKPAFERLVKSREKPIRLVYYVTDPMPEPLRQKAANIETALNEIARLVPENVDYRKISLPPNAGEQQRWPHADGALGLTPARQEIVLDDQRRPSVRNTFMSLIVQPDPDVNSIGDLQDFSAQNSVAEIRTAVEELVWTLLRPRTRLGFVLPPEDPRMRNPNQQRQPGEPPQSGHTPLMQYIQTNLAYETVWVDIAAEKSIPRDLACLIVLEANLLQERELYEIERYLAEGGNVVMLVQGWKADIRLPGPMARNLKLTQQERQPHFDEWARHVGFEVGQDLLLRRGGMLQPFEVVGRGFQQRAALVPFGVRLAPTIEPGDTNTDSVFTRGLLSMPLPLLVETRLNNERLEELELEPTELIRLGGDVYRYRPENPAFPELPHDFHLDMDSRTERDPEAEVNEKVRAQKLSRQPLAAVLLKGQFPSFWVDEKRKIPGWEGDPEEQDASPVTSPREGNLLVVSTAATLDVSYYWGYERRDWDTQVVPRGLTFYRNLAEAFIYGEDLVNLRARTGVTPRIVGPVSDNSKVTWFLACIAGVPLLLAVFAGGRAVMRARQRDEYNAAFAASGE